jgi:hypothetical protein
VGALSDPAVGKYIGENFVGCFEQVGDFRVTATANGQVNRNGGNVISYFLTPDLKVVNAIVGPVGADKLLAAAQFSVKLYEDGKYAKQDERDQIYEVAHLTESGIDPARYYQVVSEKLPRISRNYESRRRGILGSPTLKKRLKNGEITLDKPLVQARREALRAFTKDRSDSLTHRILAMQPGASVYDVYGELFERVAGETINTDRETINAAATAFKTSNYDGTPVLFVIYNPVTVDGRPQGAGRQNQRLIDRLKARVGKDYTVVALPNNQLASLSSKIDLPVYMIRVQPAVIVVKGSKKVANFNLYDSATKIARILKANK